MHINVVIISLEHSHMLKILRSVHIKRLGNSLAIRFGYKYIQDQTAYAATLNYFEC